MDLLKPCPFCGEEPEININPLWRGSHGYHDCYGISIGCENKGCAVKPKTREYDTIYVKSKNEQIKKAVYDWNKRMEAVTP